MKGAFSITYESSLTNLCEVNSSFDSGVLRVCYTGENRNKTFISKESIVRNMDTIYNCPVVCHYDRETNEIGGHDQEFVENSDGEVKLVNLTQPIGVIPESANVWFDDVVEEDGSTHEYLFVDVLLWKRQEAYAKIKKDGITAHSMEINVNDGYSDHGIYHINSFEFTAFCLLGTEEPCFESSALKTFSVVDFKNQMDQMMRDYKSTFILVNPSSEVDDTHPKNSTKGGEEILKNEVDTLEINEEQFDNEAEVVEDEAAVEEEIETSEVETEVSEAEKSEEVSEVESEVSDEESEADEQEEPEADEEAEEEFALNEQVVDEIHRVLSQETVNDDWGTHPRYWYVDCDLDAKEVYACDGEDWLLYGFNFDMNGDQIVIDFASKTRKKYSIVDFESAEPEEQTFVLEELYTLMTEKCEENKRFETVCCDMEQKCEVYAKEVKELTEFKEDCEKKEREAGQAEVFSLFEDLAGVEAFENLKAEADKYSLEALEEKCYAIRGRNGAAVNFSLKEKSNTIVVEKNEDDKNEPYGGIFKEYGIVAN